MTLRYLNGELASAGDQLIFQGERARILFIKQKGSADGFAAGVFPAQWSFMPDDCGAFLEFEDGRQVGYSTFCDHDEAILLSREPGAMA